MRLATLAALVSLLACYVGPSRYATGAAPAPAPRPAPPAGVSRPAPPPTPARRMLSEQEAVEVALGYARSQGFAAAKVKHAHLDGAGRWHLDLRGDRGHDEAKVLVDGWTGQVIRASVKDGS